MGTDESMLHVLGSIENMIYFGFQVFQRLPYEKSFKNCDATAVIRREVLRTYFLKVETMSQSRKYLRRTILAYIFMFLESTNHLTNCVHEIIV